MKGKREEMKNINADLKEEKSEENSQLVNELKKMPKKGLFLPAFFVLLTISTLVLFFSGKLLLPTNLKPKAETPKEPSPNCQLVVDIAEEATTPAPQVSPILSPAMVSTKFPVLPTASPTPSLTLTPTKTPTFTPIPTSAPLVVEPNCQVSPQGQCPTKLPLPPKGKYPRLTMTKLCRQADNICTEPGEVLLVNKNENLTVYFNVTDVSIRKACTRICDENFSNCQAWGECRYASSGGTISYSGPAVSGKYQLLVAGYSDDQNFACSSQLFYTGYNPPTDSGFTGDPAPSYCALGSACCGNKPFGLAVN